MRYAAIILVGLGMIFGPASADGSLRSLGNHYENTTFTRALHGRAELRKYCGGDNQYSCNTTTGIRANAELSSGSLPDGLHVTAIGDIEGTPTEAGDWTGTVKLTGYWVKEADAQIYEHGDLYVEFHIHVNYYCDQPQC